ncbi:MAG: hypothetical protein ACKOEV_15795, partial [Cytophagales bacterium]
MRIIATVCLLLISVSLWSQKKPAPSSTAASIDASLYAGIRWREVGPYRGGRSCTVTGVSNNPNLYYFGAVGGGVWRTNDAGQTWENLTDKY